MKGLVLSAFTLLVVAACTDNTEPATPVAPDPSAAVVPENKPAAPPLPQIVHGKVIEIAHGAKEQQLAMPLFGDQTATVSATIDQAGELVGVAFLVGNYGNKSTGTIELETCVATECRKASINTESSKDNELLAFPVEPSLAVAAGSEVKLKLTRQTSANEFAIWTFPAVAGSGKFGLADPAFQDRTAQIQLLLK